MAVEFRGLPQEIQEKMAQYRAKLLSFGMCEPTKQQAGHWLFYKPMTELTAFVVNIRGNDFYIAVTYGYASTAFTRLANNEDALVYFGVTDADITLRETVLICDAAEEAAASAKIAKMYEAYGQTPKEELLLLAKEKRKAFLQQIHSKLKPLGFRKKANSWTRTLAEPYCVTFNAQKSAFSDEYYFNLYIGRTGTGCRDDCYKERIAPSGMSPMDWQGLDKEEFDFFLEKSVLPQLEEIIATPLAQLGQIPAYWSGCLCNHQKCEACWMQKNLWEAKK